jgi:hypothetical protein
LDEIRETSEWFRIASSFMDNNTDFVAYGFSTNNKQLHTSEQLI